MWITMAWRNLWRHRRRTLITALSVAFGLWLAVTMAALGEHSYTTMIDTGARMSGGHVTMQPDGYLERPSVALRIGDVDATRRRAAALPQVLAASPRVVGQAMISAGGRSRGAQLIGIEPDFEEPEGNVYLEHIREGALFANDDTRGAVVGRGLARRLRLRLGKKLIYTTTDANGDTVSDIVRVRGIIDTGVDEIDSGVVLLPLSRLRDTLGYGPDEATRIAVVLGDQADAERVQAALRGSAPKGAAVLTWHTTMADMASYVALDRSMNQVFMGLIGLMIAAGVFNTLLMSVLERTREFGALMALGMAPWRLGAMVVAESLMIGAVGLVMGAVITAPWCVYLDRYGLDMSAAMGGERTSMGGVLVDPLLRFHMPPETLAGIVLSLFALTALAGVYPAAKASAVPPVEALRSL